MANAVVTMAAAAGAATFPKGLELLWGGQATV